MKNKVSLLVNSVLLIIGLSLIFLNSRERVLETIIMLFGVTFIVPACISLISVLVNRQGGFLPIVSVIASAGAIALGIALMAIPEFFVGIVVYIFAASLIVVGIIDLWNLLASRKEVKFGAGFFVIPVLLLMSGIIMLTLDVKSIESVAVLIVGIALVAFSINSLAEMFFKRKRIATKQDEENNVIEIQEVEKQQSESSDNHKLLD